MKKYIPVVLLVLISLDYFLYPILKNNFYNDNFSDLLRCLFVWLITLFFVSLFSFKLDNNKYKKYSIVTLIYVILTLLITYASGSRGGWGISFDPAVTVIWFISFYLIISIVYFIVQYLKKDKNI